jgi:hypothetical protein
MDGFVAGKATGTSVVISARREPDIESSELRNHDTKIAVMKFFLLPPQPANAGRAETILDTSIKFYPHFN